jgi:hypothetical protein
MGLWNYFMKWDRTGAAAKSLGAPEDPAVAAPVPTPDPRTLSRFDPGQIGKTDTVIIIGCRRAGKSTLAADLIKNIHSGSPGKVAPFADVVNGKPLTKEDVDALIKSQRAAGAAARELTIHADDTVSLDHFLPILMNGRAMKVGFIKETTHPFGLPPLPRSQFDYVFIFPDASDDYLSTAWQNYATGVPTFGAFRSIVRSLTRFQALVLDRKKPHSVPFSDQLWFYEACPVE